MNTNTTNEIDLLKASLAGNTTAFEAIVHRYQSIICAMTFSATGSIDKSEELAQETFIKAWKDLAKLRELAKFKEWLYAIARTTVKQHYRCSQRDPIKGASPIDAASSVPSDQPDPVETVISKEHQAIVAAAIKHIPEDYRQPLILFYRHNQSTKAVAAALEITEEAARQRLHRARKMLKKKITSIVEITIADSAPTKAFTAIVMTSITALALKTTAVATITSAASTTTAASTATSILSTLTAKAITAAAIAAIAISSAFIYNNTTQTYNEVAIAKTTQSQLQLQPNPKLEKPDNTSAPAPTIPASSSNQPAKQPNTPKAKTAVAPEPEVETIPAEPETDTAKAEQAKYHTKAS